MSENKSLNPDPIQPLSISELFRVFFSGAVNAFKDFLRFLFRNKILLICFIIGGIGLGYLQYEVSPTYYRVDMMVRHTELTTRAYGQMLGSLNRLAESGSYGMLAQSLRLDNQTAGKIRALSAETLDGTDIRKDTSTATNRDFVIRIDIRDNSIADTLQKALLAYFNENPYLSKLKENEVRVYTEKLEFINNELARMDSLTAAYTKSLLLPRGPGYTPLDAGTLLAQTERFVEIREVLQRWLLGKRDALLVIDSVRPSLVPASVNATHSILVYAVVAFFLGCLVAGVVEIIKNLSV